MITREPTLIPVALSDLRPTQITVGMREVEEKRRAWRERPGSDGDNYLGRHMIPVLKGPKDRSYVIDHHHLTRALMEEGVKDILVNVVADLSALVKSEFWNFCDNRGWCHPYDADGNRVEFSAIPKSLLKMPDDPYRSLAGALRGAGGFAKDAALFSEFIWADFLRRRVKRALVEDNFAKALTRALILAKAREADHLPGWCGPAA